jgi:hypothetical protein
MKFKCGICDQMFSGFIGCREHIIESHLSGLEDSVEDEISFRKKLTWSDLQEVDHSIMVIQENEAIGGDASGVPLDECYNKVYPFNKRKEDWKIPYNDGHFVANPTVYVAQMRPIRGNAKHVYVGSTTKDIDRRYREHVTRYKTGSKKFWRNKHEDDPCTGFRWDLLFRIHDHEEEKCYSEEDALEVEGWLHSELESLGYTVVGDMGKPLDFRKVRYSIKI